MWALQLQYYNRRRCGDKQRTLPLMPKVTIQVIKPKEGNISEAASEKSNETGKKIAAEMGFLLFWCAMDLTLRFVFVFLALSKEILSSETISKNSLNSVQISASDTDVLPLSSELPLFPGSISNKGNSKIILNKSELFLFFFFNLHNFPFFFIKCLDILLQDEDCKSSCSSITRFLKQALPEVLPQSVNPSPDGKES